MQAIILAAGMGKRLGDLTANNTKCMVKVNGISLIERMLSQLDTLTLSRIVIVVGYQSQTLIDYIGTLGIATPIEFIENSVFDKTNNIYSLSLAKEALVEDDTLLLESDIIFEPGVIQALVKDPRPTLALVDKYESWMDGTVVTIGLEDKITSFISKEQFRFEAKSNYYKTVNIYKFSKHFSKDIYVPVLNAYSKVLGVNTYYEQVLRMIISLDFPEIRAKQLHGEKWYEIDDVQDLDIAESIFAEASEQAMRLSHRFGGYWRYPKLLDFCYLVNPFFPTRRMQDELKASFSSLLTQYPSGMHINSLLAARNFGIKPDHIVVGNGAAEIIRSLMFTLHGKVGFIRPTFEEYPNRYAEQENVVYYPSNEDFSYSADDLITFFADKHICALVLINPDNPSGNYIDKARLLQIAKWSEQNNITLILDESFADFSDELDNTLIDEQTLARYPHLIVIKSISKSYGVPGLRLGIAASSNETLISALKKDVSIWNINSFAEFFLQIQDKYRKDYCASLQHFKEVRANFVAVLKQLSGIRVLPTQANYVMVELNAGLSASELTQRLLSEYNILIKDLSKKMADTRQFVRLAIRDENDNLYLLNALKCILNPMESDNGTANRAN